MAEDSQKTYLEYQFLQQAIAQMHQKKAIIQNQMSEFFGLMENLESLKNSKKDSQIYAAIGSGVFVRAELKEKDNVLVNIGSNVALERSVQDAKKLVANQLDELKSLLKQLDADIEENIRHTNFLGKKLSEAQVKPHEHKH